MHKLDSIKKGKPCKCVRQGFGGGELQQLLHARSEPAPAAPKATCCRAELSHKQYWLCSGRAGLRNKKRLCNCRWERGVRNKREAALGPPGSAQEEGRRCSRHGAEALCSPGKAHSRANYPSATQGHHAEHMSRCSMGREQPWRSGRGQVLWTDHSPCSSVPQGGRGWVEESGF